MKAGETTPYEGVLVPFDNYREFELLYQENNIRRQSMSPPQAPCIQEPLLSTKTLLAFIAGGVTIGFLFKSIP